MTHCAHLSDRALLTVSGSDAANFLQGLITADINAVSLDRLIYSLLLTPQGKLAFEFFVGKQGDGYVIECEAEQRESLLKRLIMFKLRSDVVIASIEDCQVYASWPEGDLLDPRNASLGGRHYGQGHEANATLADYHGFLRQNGVPVALNDVEPERSTALECGFDALGAIAWDKGCFMGQEVTARMRYRGLVKRLMIASKTELTVGQSLYANGKAIARIASPWFASVKSSHLQQADWACQDESGQTIALIKPIWWERSVAVANWSG